MPLLALAPAVATAVTGIYGAHRVSSSADAAAKLTADASNRAADLATKSNADALAFQTKTEADRHAEWQATQDKNYSLYQEQQARLAPYRAMGTGALNQLMQPIGQRPPPGSLGASMGGR